MGKVNSYQFVGCYGLGSKQRGKFLHYPDGRVLGAVEDSDEDGKKASRKLILGSYNHQNDVISFFKIPSDVAICPSAWVFRGDHSSFGEPIGDYEGFGVPVNRFDDIVGEIRELFSDELLDGQTLEDVDPRFLKSLSLDRTVDSIERAAGIGGFEACMKVADSY